MAASKKSLASTVKRPISRKRIRANRRNAKKSTGPKSAEGKRIVSRNALTHGLRSQHFPVLPYENSAEYREFEEAMERDCYPQGILQRQVVFQITQISWKLRRIPAIEAALLKYHNLRGHKEFEEGKEDGTFGENDQLAEPTVKNHVTAILKALKVTNRTEAVIAVNGLFHRDGARNRRGGYPWERVSVPWAFIASGASNMSSPRRSTRRLSNSSNSFRTSGRHGAPTEPSVD